MDHFWPESFDYKALKAENRQENMNMAFYWIDKHAGVTPLLQAEDIIRLGRPDENSAMLYLNIFIQETQSHPRNVFFSS